MLPFRASLATDRLVCGHRLAADCPAQKPLRTMTTFVEFASAFHDHFTLDPNDCVKKGVDRRLDELPDPTLEHARLVVEDAARLLGELDAQRAASPLGFEDLLDLDLAELALKAELFSHTYRFNGRTRLEQLPSAGTDIGDGIFLLLANDPRPVGDRLADITRRLQGVPDYLEKLLARLDHPIERWVHIDLEKVRGLPSLIDSVERLGGQAAFADLAELRRASLTAREALSNYASRLASLATTREVHVGERNTARIVQLRGIDLTLDELCRTAKEFLAETSEVTDELRRRLTDKYNLDPTLSASELQRWLAARHCLEVPGDDFSVVLRRYERELERLVAFNDKLRLFPVPERQSVRVLQTPPFMTPSIPAGAMMPPPPFRSGDRTSLVYLTLSHELLEEHTELGIPLMMLHEAIPGHHLQLTSASLHPSVIRRHIDAMDQAEGWTTMLEDYMLDVGYMGELVDEARFVAKREIGRIGARVAIDVFFMTGDPGRLEVGVDFDRSNRDPFALAGSLLGAVTGFVPERIDAELNWYSQERGYPLSYLAGNRLVWNLKHDVARHLGQSDALESDRRFFRAYLEAGNMPVAYLRRWFEEHGLLPGGR